MERENRKRGREEEEEQQQQQGEEATGRRVFKEKSAAKREFLGGVDDCETLKLSDSFQPLGVFEFPWEKEENLVSESEWKSHDVFYSSLLDGCCSVVEYPVDDGPLCEIPAPELVSAEGKPEEESWPQEGEEIDGVDCIWSCVLSQPLSVGATKVSSLR